MYVTKALNGTEISVDTNWYIQGRNLIKVNYVTIVQKYLDIWRDIDWNIQGRDLTNKICVITAVKGLIISTYINLYIQGRNLTNVIYVSIMLQTLELSKDINFRYIHRENHLKVYDYCITMPVKIKMHQDRNLLIPKLIEVLLGSWSIYVWSIIFVCQEERELSCRHQFSTDRWTDRHTDRQTDRRMDRRKLTALVKPVFPLHNFVGSWV